MQSFKLAGLALAPFGEEIVRTKDLRSGAWAQTKVAATIPTPPPASEDAF